MAIAFAALSRLVRLSAAAFTPVSYTHLDVYKRQVLFSVSSPSICLSRFLHALAPSSFESNESDVMDGTLSVSYTHLDVYKRQVLDFVEGVNLATVPSGLSI